MIIDIFYEYATDAHKELIVDTIRDVIEYVKIEFMLIVKGVSILSHSLWLSKWAIIYFSRALRRKRRP